MSALELIPTHDCAGCGKKRDKGTVYFCRTCWWKLPAQERHSLYRMHHRGIDTRTKVEKLVRIMKEKATAL